MTVQVVKLVTGEEIIGDVTIDDRFTVKKPCSLQWVPSRSNPEQPMMALIPYAMHLEEHSITVLHSQVLWHGTPVKELYNQYNQAFGSGIQLAGL